ncbi:MAG TPA: GlcNAc-transferase family protein [Gemmatimonadaceae bacterium]|nr:GlcNAc-transferase family protein [Gemmatimonadaceae bacterium]
MERCGAVDIHMNGDIFIQMAAYRDPQLGPTLRDAIAQASDPSRLHFCVAWQHADDETRDEVFAGIDGKARLTILDIPHGESRGACWARHLIQQRYAGEAYTLQLDSHHRFAAGWDDLCVGMLEDLRADGVAKPLLTAYLPSFDPDNDPAARVQAPWHLVLDRFIPEGAIFFRPATMPAWDVRTRPMPARFYSAHFAFTLGAFAREVRHDPGLYFHGEEISITVRAYTHGYDLFHPHRLVAWHEYTRKGRTKHWDDHTDWGAVNVVSHARNRTLFGMDEFAAQPDVVAAVQHGEYGFGQVRTVADYERYAGICFRRRAVTRAVLDGTEPARDDNTGIPYDAFVASCIPRFRHCIDIGYDRVPLDDYDYWLVVLKDAEGNDLYRRDADPAEITAMKRDPAGYCKLWREFDSDIRPASWLVWPHSQAHGWCRPVFGNLPWPT